VTIGIVGAGSWGTALGVHLSRAGGDVRLWAREPEVVAGIRGTRRNPYYLTEIPIPDGVHATGDLGEAVDGVEIVIVAVPSEFVASTLTALERIPDGTPVVSATKGFDPLRHLRMTQLVAARFPSAPVAALSGPTFAREVAAGQPTAAVVASGDEVLAARLQHRLGTREFRLYTNRDVAGVETGGALKNVIAIATGLADGLSLGENARAALITRGLAEITRLAVALGGQPRTLAGLAGLGDLVLTCTGSLSRNHTLGMELAKGTTRESWERSTKMIAEGARTAQSADALARRHGVSLPITREIAAVLFEDKPAREALAALLDRPRVREDGDA
jgi:glycerol-3-phosphate dehydrogenase (NAD(P)+)